MAVYKSLDGELTIGDSLAKLISAGSESPNSRIQSGHYYAGAVPGGNGSSVADYGIADFTNSFRSFNFHKSSNQSTVNLKWFCSINNSGSNLQYISKAFLRWTGLDERGIEAYNANYGERINVNSWVSNQNSTNVSSLSYAQNHHRIAPVEKMNINNVVFNAYVLINSITYEKVDGVEYYRRSSASVKEHLWDEVKIEDEYKQGVDFNQNLWDKGYEIESTDNKIVVKYVSGIKLYPYIGIGNYIFNSETNKYEKDEKIEASERSSVNNTYKYDTYPTVGTTSNSILTLLPMREIYIPELNSVVYSAIPGIEIGNISYTSNSTDYFLDGSGKPYTTLNAGTINYYFQLSSASTSVSVNKTDQIPNEISDEDRISQIQLISTNIAIDLSGEFPETISTGYFKFGEYQFGNIGSSKIGYSFIRPYSIKEVWATVASLGVYVSGNSETAIKAKTGKEVDSYYLYCGEMLGDGTTTGKMIQGKAIANLPQTEMDDISDSPYSPVDPSGGGGGLDPGGDMDVDPSSRNGDNIGLNLDNRLATFSGFLTMYNMNYQQLANFGSALMGEPLKYRGNFQKDLSEELSGTYDVSSILNYIVSVKQYPFSVATLQNTSTAGTSDIFIGTGDFAIPVGTSCRTLTSSISVLRAGNLTVKPIDPYNDFRDYYNTSITAYLPYCGTVELNPMEIIGSYLECFYLIDFFTGECTSVLYSTYNNMSFPVAIANGVIGIDVPLSANNSGQLSAVKRMENAQLAHTVISYVNSGIQTAENISQLIMNDIPNKNVGGIVSDITGILRNSGDIVDTAFSHGANPYGGNKSARSAVASPIMAMGSGATNVMLPNAPYIQIRRGTYSRPDNYGHTMAYPNSYSSRLSAVSGLTVCYNVDVSGINCTVEEKKAIKSALESGVIL